MYIRWCPSIPLLRLLFGPFLLSVLLPFLHSSLRTNTGISSISWQEQNNNNSDNGVGGSPKNSAVYQSSSVAEAERNNTIQYMEVYLKLQGVGRSPRGRFVQTPRTPSPPASESWRSRACSHPVDSRSPTKARSSGNQATGMRKLTLDFFSAFPSFSYLVAPQSAT